MNAQEKIQRAYMVTVKEFPEGEALYIVSYVPRGLQQARTGGKAKKVPEYIATVNAADGDAAVVWDVEPSDPEASLVEFAKDARRRVSLLHPWLALLSDLVSSVEGWAISLEWLTKRVDKPMEETEIGSYKTVALLMQRDITRVLLEPVGRAAPGAEGVVDLYLLPGLDDVASLYYYGNRWNLHYMPPGSEPVGNIREAEARPLNKATLRKVLDEMSQHGR